MKLKRDPLLEALLTLSPLSGKRTILPILNHFHIGTTNGKLVIRATDGENDAYEEIDCADNMESVCVPSSLFLTAVRSAGEDVDLQLNKGHLAVVCSTFSVIVLPAMDGSEFPPAKNDIGQAFGVNAADVSRVISSVYWAATPDSLLVEETWVHVFTDGNSIVAESTDRRTMARCQIAAIAAPFDILLPSRSAGGVAEFLNRDGAQIHLSETRLTVTHDNGRFSTALGNGKSLPISKVLDCMTCSIGSIPVKPLAESVAVADSLVRNFARVKLAFGKGLNVKLKDGTTSYDKTLDVTTGNMEVAFDPARLLTALKHLDETAEVFYNPEKPTLGIMFKSGDVSIGLSALSRE